MAKHALQGVQFENRGYPQFIRPTAAALAVAACFSGPVLANPTNPTVTHGTASFATAGNILNVTNSHNAIINWGSFSIGVNELTRFIQPSALSAVLNRVTGQDPSAILGALQSNGRVFILNPNGIMFGSGAQINVAGLVASTLKLSDDDFLNNRMKFTDGVGAGSVVNNGSITGGSVYLVGNAVTNNGLITSPGGEVVLAAGNSVELVNPGTPNLRVEIVAPDNEAINLGTITADAGRIGIYAGLIKQSGTISADSAVSEGGRIVLKSTKKTLLEAGSLTSARGTSGGEIIALSSMTDGVTEVAGKMDASGTAGNGGFIETSAAKVKIADTAVITAASTSGNAGTWLIDPNDFTISSSYGGDISGSTLASQLNAYGGTNITIVSDDGGTAGSGNIYVEDAISWNSAGDLTLIARNDIEVNNSITNGGAGGLGLYAGWNGGSMTTPAVSPGVGEIRVNAPISVGNTINMVAGGAVQINSSVLANGRACCDDGGSATVNISGSSILIDDMVKALAGDGSEGGVGGDGVINLVASGGITVYGSLEARGGVGGYSDGRGGDGKIMLSAGDSIVTNGSILAQGGTGGYYYGAGGDAIIEMTAANTMSIASDVSAFGGNGVGGGAASVQLSAVNGLTVSNGAWAEAYGGSGLSMYGGAGGAASVQLTSTNGAINIVDGAEVYVLGGQAGYVGSTYAAGGAASAKLTAGNGILVDGGEYSEVRAFGGYGSTGGTATVELKNNGASSAVQIVNGAYVLAEAGDGSEGGVAGSALVMVSSAGGITFSGSSSIYAAGGTESYGGGVGGAAGVTLSAGGNILIDGSEGYASGGSGSGTGGNAGVNVVAGGGITVSNGYWTASAGSGSTAGAASVVLAAAGNLTLNNNAYINTYGAVGLGGANILLDGADVFGDKGVQVDASGNLDVINGSTLSASNVGMFIKTGGNVTVDNSGIFGNPDVKMTVGGVINMNNGGQIMAGMPSTIYLTFPMLTSGGFFVNGMEGVVYDLLTSTGFCAQTCPALLGTNLLVTYGGGAALNIPTDALIVAMGESSKPPDPEKDKNVFEEIEDGKKKDAPVCR